MVLLIDDSNAVNNMNEHILRSTNYFEEIHQSTSAKHAINFLQNHSYKLPELIFLDINMPEEDGFDFLKEYIELEEVSKSNYTPVIVIVSENLDIENLTKSKSYKTYGVLDHIRKPIEKEDILNLLEEHFEGFGT